MTLSRNALVNVPRQEGKVSGSNPQKAGQICQVTFECGNLGSNHS